MGKYYVLFSIDTINILGGNDMARYGVITYVRILSLLHVYVHVHVSVIVGYIIVIVMECGYTCNHYSRASLRFG